MKRLLAVGAVALAGCGSSFAHSPTPTNLRDCIAQTVKERALSVALGSGGPRPAGSSAAVEFGFGGPFQRGGADVEAPAYTVDLYLFDNAAAASAALATLPKGPSMAHYSLGRAVVADSIGAIGATPAALPGGTQAAIRSCLRRTGYL